LAQLSAVDLLASGMNDTQAAERLSLSRVTVTRWRCYDLEFQAALNRRRAEVWGVGVDRLRSLVLEALDALGEVLAAGDAAAKVKAASVILNLAQLPSPAPSGPTSAEAALDALVEARVKAKQAERVKHLSESDRLLASMTSPGRGQAEADEQEARREVLAELESRLGEAEEAAP
jgi:hypothetical protein